MNWPAPCWPSKSTAHSPLSAAIPTLTSSGPTKTYRFFANRPIRPMRANSMLNCMTKYFGAVAYEEAAVLDFPAGLPGFEQEKAFLSLEQSGHQPLVFLQSLATP